MEQGILVFVLVGFLAQIIDGALGMAYGVTSTTVLLGIGLPPATASASVHAAEVFTTAVSGVSHFRFGNVDLALFKRLLIPGVVGGVLGAYVLTQVPGDVIKPIVAVYLAIMGVIILLRAMRSVKAREVRRMAVPLGLAGGFMDAIGGGGWGPVVTSTLIARGKEPRTSIGSVNLAEFFVTLAESITFVLTLALQLQHWRIIVGLLLGGVAAAPLAAFVCKKVPVKPMMIMVGTLIIVLSARTLYLALI